MQKLRDIILTRCCLCSENYEVYVTLLECRRNIIRSCQQPDLRAPWIEMEHGGLRQFGIPPEVHVLRNIKRPNYCELDDSDDDDYQQITIKRRRNRSVTPRGRNNVEAEPTPQRISRRRFSESAAVSLLRNEELRDNPDYALEPSCSEQKRRKSKRNISKSASNINVCAFCNKTKTAYGRNESENVLSFADEDVESVTKNVYHKKSSRPENLYVLSGDEKKSSDKARASIKNRPRSASTSQLSNNSTSQKETFYKPRDGGLTIDRQKSEEKSVNPSRKRKSDTVINYTRQNKENASEKSKPEQSSSEKQDVEQGNKNNGEKAGTSFKSNNITYRKSTGCIPQEDPKNAKTAHENNSTKNNKDLLDVEPKKIVHRRRSKSAKNLKGAYPDLNARFKEQMKRQSEKRLSSKNGTMETLGTNEAKTSEDKMIAGPSGLQHLQVEPKKIVDRLRSGSTKGPKTNLGEEGSKDQSKKESKSSEVNRKSLDVHSAKKPVGRKRAKSTDGKIIVDKHEDAVDSSKTNKTLAKANINEEGLKDKSKKQSVSSEVNRKSLDVHSAKRPIGRKRAKSTEGKIIVDKREDAVDSNKTTKKSTKTNLGEEGSKDKSKKESKSSDVNRKSLDVQSTKRSIGRKRAKSTDGKIIDNKQEEAVDSNKTNKTLAKTNLNEEDLKDKSKTQSISSDINRKSLDVHSAKRPIERKRAKSTDCKIIVDKNEDAVDTNMTNKTSAKANLNKEGSKDQLKKQSKSSDVNRKSLDVQSTKRPIGRKRAKSTDSKIIDNKYEDTVDSNKTNKTPTKANVDEECLKDQLKKESKSSDVNRKSLDVYSEKRPIGRKRAKSTDSKIDVNKHEDAVYSNKTDTTVEDCSTNPNRRDAKYKTDLHQSNNTLQMNRKDSSKEKRHTSAKSTLNELNSEKPTSEEICTHSVPKKKKYEKLPLRKPKNVSASGSKQSIKIKAKSLCKTSNGKTVKQFQDKTEDVDSNNNCDEPPTKQDEKPTTSGKDVYEYVDESSNTTVVSKENTNGKNCEEVTSLKSCHKISGTRDPRLSDQRKPSVEENKVCQCPRSKPVDKKPSVAVQNIQQNNSYPVVPVKRRRCNSDPSLSGHFREELFRNIDQDLLEIVNNRNKAGSGYHLQTNDVTASTSRDDPENVEKGHDQEEETRRKEINDNQAGSFSPETQLRRLFNDENEIEKTRMELIRILAASSEESDSSDRSPERIEIIDDGIEESEVITIEDDDSPWQGAFLGEVIVIESDSDDSDDCPVVLTAEEAPRHAQTENMTKMEHYKKRLIYQHEKPLLQAPLATTEDEDNSRSVSPTSSVSSVLSNQNTLLEKKKEEPLPKVAKKRAVSRKQFRHQNLELFRLGTSIPTSLCKTKEPYHISSGRNLQMCCLPNGKKDANPMSITDAIINSMEGPKRRDTVLWRSVSMNDGQRTINNDIREDDQSVGRGRHILPAIIPDISDRRSRLSPTPKTATQDKEESSNNVIRKAEPISINQRKYITQRRKTVIGIESSNTNATNRDRPEFYSEPVSLRNSPPIREINGVQNSPMNLSMHKPTQNNTERAQTSDNFYAPRLGSGRNHQRKQSVPHHVNGHDIMNPVVAHCPPTDVPLHMNGIMPQPVVNFTPRNVPRHVNALENIPVTGQRQSVGNYPLNISGISQLHPPANFPPMNVPRQVSCPEDIPGMSQVCASLNYPPLNPPCQVNCPEDVLAMSQRHPHANYPPRHAIDPENVRGMSQLHPAAIYPPINPRHSGDVPGMSQGRPAANCPPINPRHPGDVPATSQGRPVANYPPNNPRHSGDVSGMSQGRPAANYPPINPRHSGDVPAMSQGRPAVDYPPVNPRHSGDVPGMSQGRSAANYPPINPRHSRDVPGMSQGRSAADYPPVNPRHSGDVPAMSQGRPPVNSSAQRPAKASQTQKNRNNYQGNSFSQIHQQMMRLQPLENRNPIRQDVRQVPIDVDNNEDIIKTIIQLVKSSMDPSFSIEILLILNKWFIELSEFSRQPNVAKHVKAAIRHTLEDVICYVVHNLFQCQPNKMLNLYVKEMMLMFLPPHKTLLIDILPVLRTTCHTAGWMHGFLRLLSHPPSRVSAECLVNGAVNESRNTIMPDHVYGQDFMAPPGLMLPPEHFLAQQPRGLRPPPPYDAIHFTEPPRQNVERNVVPREGPQRQRACPVPVIEHRKVPIPSTVVRPESPERTTVADNRCVPPKGDSQATPSTSKANVIDKIEVTPTIQPIISKNCISNGIKDNNRVPSPKDDHNRINIQAVNVIKDPVNPSNAMQPKETKTVPDVEEMLHTNVIVSKNAITAPSDEPKVKDTPESKEKEMEVEKIAPNVNENTEKENQADTAVAPLIECDTTTDRNKAIPSTVIVQDNSMEITKSGKDEDISHTTAEQPKTNCNEIVVERIRYVKNCENGPTPSTLTLRRNGLAEAVDLNINMIKVVQRKVDSGGSEYIEESSEDNPEAQEYLLYCNRLEVENRGQNDKGEVITIDDDEDVFVEEGIEMPRPQEALPKLIRLPPPRKRFCGKAKDGQNDKTKKNAMAIKRKNNSVINIEDEKEGASKAVKITDSAKESDCNQNYIIENNGTSNSDTSSEKSGTGTDNAVPDSPIRVQQDNVSVITGRDPPVGSDKSTLSGPLIENISSDDEALEPFEHYNAYESKSRREPSKTLENCAFSACNIIKGSMKGIEEAVRNRFHDRGLLYTKPVVPRQLRNNAEETQESSSRSLEGSFLNRAVTFEEDATSLTCHVNIQHPSERSPKINTSFTPSPQYSKTPPSSSATPVRQIVPTFVPTQSPLPESARPNWKDFISVEKRKGFFNFARSLSTDSVNDEATERRANRSTDNEYYEIKIDSKVYTIKKSVYEKIPKGKLCFVRKTNTFIRYFDDKQMELFMRNLDISEGSLVASDLLRQVKGRADSLTDIEVSPGPYDTSKNEIITLSNDVQFLAEDYISDPEVYIEEMDKVKKYIPKDFFGFYKYVTGYQIVNNHPPISFQTFLTMHNTNGLRGLLKNYINTLAQGKNASCIPEDFTTEF